MSRGPRPRKAQDESLLIAAKRGLVMGYRHRRGNICDFSIMSPGLVSFFCVMRLIRLSSTPEDILHDFSAAIGQLRFIASSGAISRELWLRTPRGAWRFFRILDDSIRELGPDGMPLANIRPVKETAPAQGTGLIAKLKKALKAATTSRGGGKAAAGTDPKKTTTPAQSPERAIDPALDLEPEKDPGAVNDPKCPSKPEKTPELPEKTVEPVKNPGQEGALAPAPEKIPEHIRKFLRRRNAALEQLRSPHEPVTAENRSVGEYPAR